MLRSCHVSALIIAANLACARTSFADPPAPPKTEATQVSTMRVVAITVAGFAAAALTVGVIERVRYSSLADDANAARTRVPASVTDVCQAPNDPNAADACQHDNDAKSARTLSYAFLGAGLGLAITSVVLFVVDPARSEKGDVTVAPRVSKTGGGLDVRIAF
jgi:hypothetical protein